jgi:hypothetical protein
MLMFSKGEAITVTVERREASKIGAYMSQVAGFLTTNDQAYLRLFEGMGVEDIRRVAHPFETEPNTLYRLAHTGDETFEHVYRIVLP